MSAVHSTPPPADRPLDTWRVCGRLVDEGCTCGPFGPSRAEVAAALARAAQDDEQAAAA